MSQDWVILPGKIVSRMLLLLQPREEETMKREQGIGADLGRCLRTRNRKDKVQVKHETRRVRLGL